MIFAESSCWLHRLYMKQKISCKNIKTKQKVAKNACYTMSESKVDETQKLKPAVRKLSWEILRGTDL